MLLRAARYLLRTIAVLVIAAATFALGVFLLGAFNIVHPPTVAAASAPIAHASCTMMINAGACLDHSNIDDLRPTDPAAIRQAKQADCASITGYTNGKEFDRCVNGPVGTEVQVAGHTWAVTVSGLEPVSSN